MPTWEEDDGGVVDESDADLDSVSGSYNPQYVGLGDIPIAGPDSDPSLSDGDTTPTKRRKALFFAESKIELDVNDGNTIDEDDVSRHHQSAIMNLATHLLTAAAEEPDSVSLADMAQGAGGAIEASTPYLDNYKSIISGIRESDEDAGGIDNHFRAVNGRSSPARKRSKRKKGGHHREYYG